MKLLLFIYKLSWDYKNCRGRYYQISEVSEVYYYYWIRLMAPICLRPISVTRQVTFKKWWKIPEFKNSNATFWVILKHCDLMEDCKREKNSKWRKMKVGQKGDVRIDVTSHITLRFTYSANIWSGKSNRNESSIRVWITSTPIISSPALVLVT